MAGVPGLLLPGGGKKSNQPGAITADHRYVGAGALRTPFLQLSPAPRGNPPFLNKEFCFDIVGPHSCTAQCTAVSDLEGSNTHSEWPIPKKSILQYSIRPNAVKVTYSGSFFDMSITQCFRVPMVRKSYHSLYLHHSFRSFRSLADSSALGIASQSTIERHYFKEI